MAANLDAPERVFGAPDIAADSGDPVDSESYSNFPNQQGNQPPNPSSHDPQIHHDPASQEPNVYDHTHQHQLVNDNNDNEVDLDDDLDFSKAISDAFAAVTGDSTNHLDLDNEGANQDGNPPQNDTKHHPSGDHVEVVDIVDTVEVDQPDFGDAINATSVAASSDSHQFNPELEDTAITETVDGPAQTSGTETTNLDDLNDLNKINASNDSNSSNLYNLHPHQALESVDTTLPPEKHDTDPKDPNLPVDIADHKEPIIIEPEFQKVDRHDKNLQTSSPMGGMGAVFEHHEDSTGFDDMELDLEAAIGNAFQSIKSEGLLGNLNEEGSGTNASKSNEDTNQVHRKDVEDITEASESHGTSNIDSSVKEGEVNVVQEGPRKSTIDDEHSVSSTFSNHAELNEHTNSIKEQVESSLGNEVHNAIEEAKKNAIIQENIKTSNESDLQKESITQNKNPEIEYVDAEDDHGNSNSNENDSMKDVHHLPLEDQHESDDDFALEQAIGNVFSELTKDQSLVQHASSSKHVEAVPDLTKHSDVASNIVDEGDDDMDADLEAAIGNAFQNAVGNTMMGTSNIEVINDTNKDESSEKKDEANVNYDNAGEDDDLDLDEAIAASFKQALGKDDTNVNGIVNNQSHTHSHLNRRDSISVALAGALASEGIISSGISEDALQELALQITSQVQGEAVSKKKPEHLGEMPQIDENILEHFQNEAYNESHGSGEDLNSQKLQSVIANAVKNAMASSNQIPSSNVGDGVDLNEVADLELLRMNEILQNALNMAAENPQDLLSNLDMDEDLSSATGTSSSLDLTGTSSSNSVVAALSRLSHPLPSTTAAFLESLRRSQDIDLARKDRDGSRSKPLLIAETLALHRLSMSGALRRDYLQIDLLDQVLRNDKGSGQQDSINERISNALLSISSHINSNGTSGEILQVIRQMTNSLLNGKSYPLTTGPPTIHDIIASYNKDKSSLEDITNSLKVARNFLQTNGSELDHRAAPIIDNVLKMFDQYSAGMIDFSAPPLRLSDDMDLAISSVRDLVLLSISSFTSSRYWKFSLFLGEKPKNDTPEYKERIRLENRERKKKWREENAERNKDNDLRSRVIKRAAAIYGDMDTQDKKLWIENEYQSRKAKRIAKQKKDEEEKKNYFSANGDPATNSSNLTTNASLNKLLADVFNLMDNSSLNIDPEVALAATSVATAAAATTFAKSVGASVLEIGTAVSSIMLTLMDSIPSMGLKERLINLLRGLLSVLKSKVGSDLRTTRGPGGLPPTSSSVSYLQNSNASGSSGQVLASTNISTIGLTPRSLTADPFRYGEKRKPLDYLNPSVKRLSLGPSNAASEANALKLPKYKKPEPFAKKTTNSPFLSHKIPVSDTPTEVTATSSTPPASLKKPGFQRPSFAKPEARKPAASSFYSSSRLNNV